MNLGIFEVTYERLAESGFTTLEMVDLAKAQGFVSFEPYPFDDLQTVSSAKKLGDYASEREMMIPCFSAGIDLIGKDYKAEMERAKLYIEMASAMQSPYYHQTIYPHLLLNEDAPELSDAMKKAVPRLKELCRYAAERNITCLFEEQGMLFNGVKASKMLEKELEGFDFGFCLDVGNIYLVDEEPISFLKVFHHRIKHIHLKDYYYKQQGEEITEDGWMTSRNGNHYRYAIPGEGIIDYKGLMYLIKKIGYRGYFSLEYCGTDTNEHVIPQAKNNIERYYDMTL